MEGASADGRPDSWVQQALRISFTELLRFVKTWLGLLFTPRKLARGWRDLSRPVMNPAGFTASALAVSLLVHELDPARPTRPSASLLFRLVADVGPYAYFGLLGATAYVFLRGLRVRGPLQQAIGAALLSGSAVAVLLELAFEGVSFGYQRITGTVIPLNSAATFLLLGACLLFVINVTLLIATTYETRVWKAAFATCAAFIVMSTLDCFMDARINFSTGLFASFFVPDAAGHWHLGLSAGWTHGS